MEARSHTQRLWFADDVGAVLLLLGRALRKVFRRGHDFGELMRQLARVGVASVPVVVLTALSTGMVMGLQMYQGFERFGAGSFTGGVVALTIVREVAPVFTGIMLTGRVGSAFAAELATMRTTEQIDALVAMGTDPVQYLFVPRIAAVAVMLPALQLLSVGVGLLGGRLVAVGLSGANPVEYDRSTFQLLELSDLSAGLIKSAVFGVMIAAIACARGYGARRGAEGVGKATTSAVVSAYVCIVVADFFLSKLLY